MTDNTPAATDEHEALLTLLKSLKECGYQFTTVTPATQQRVNNRSGNAMARNLADIFGWSRPFQPGVVPVEMLALMAQADVIARNAGGWRSRVRVSSLDRQLFVHSAYPTTAADAVFFGPDTARFAQAIQLYVAGHPASPRRVVDIGCGAGPGAILLAKAWPQAEVVAVDINDQALAMTRVNARLAGTTNVRACHSDLLDGVDGEFDLIVSNPPYLVDMAERAYRHGGGQLGAGLSQRIVDAALARLAPGGTLLLYTGVAIIDGQDPFRQAVAGRLTDELVQWDYREMDPDVFGEELLTPAYAGADRIAAVVLTLTKRS